MKRITCFIITGLMLLALAGCGATNIPAAESNGDTPASALPSGEAATDIDVDLTELSSTMVFAEIFNMMSSPQDYEGKTVKMSGQFAVYQTLDANDQPIPEQTYFACVVTDVSSCCVQGLEFVLAGEHTYPDDYPELNTVITVIGTFNTYEEDGYMYCQLINARLVD